MHQHQIQLTSFSLSPPPSACVVRFLVTSGDTALATSPSSGSRLLPPPLLLLLPLPPPLLPLLDDFLAFDLGDARCCVGVLESSATSATTEMKVSLAQVMQQNFVLTIISLHAKMLRDYCYMIYSTRGNAGNDDCGNVIVAVRVLTPPVPRWRHLH